jgi:cyanophycinase
VQLGALGWRDDEEGTTPSTTFDTLRLVPFVIDVHDEDRGWRRLRRTVAAHGEPTRGLGIPRRGGLVVHPDHTLEPLASVVTEVSLEDGKIVESLLVPEP